MSLPAGDYCLVPSTYESGQEAEFLMAVWVDHRWECELERRTGERVRDHQVGN